MKNAFTNTVEHFSGKVIEIKRFETREDAKKAKRATIKEMEMVKYAGRLVNFSNNIELHTNY